MVQTEGFKKWLKENTNLSDAAIGDTASRIRRADRILSWNDTETYLFYLEREQRFVALSVSVKSQIRKAVRLYMAYVEALSGMAENSMAQTDLGEGL